MGILDRWQKKDEAISKKKSQPSKKAVTGEELVSIYHAYSI